ncbi:hypothetical protein D0Z07_0751 [Hyphodiscus hymeniophilus]|uniref:Uncharacterized protein n=1 Tax=Hyphodiscus hymeniophilus TaxID=353542 RepID=A0A9P6VS00_9HELO|nr:hypothetical protein D0Z07_0751 [Hyphodiscus hymeniophilus]
MMSLRLRYAVLTTIALLIFFLSTHYYHSSPTLGLLPNGLPRPRLTDLLHTDASSPPPSPPLTRPTPPIYKPTLSAPAIQIVDNFPLAAAAHSSADLPPLPSWNAPPNPHVNESTPLFIGFTRNWRLFQQVVVSYITSGWPAEDIYVVENTGVMDSNSLGLLSLQNPFFLNHTRLGMLGVNVLVTPTLFTFAQLQNYYLWTATQNFWPHYFWSHMDVVSLSLESAVRFPPKASTNPPSSHLRETSDPWENNTLYTNCLLQLRELTSPHPDTAKVKKWASVFFSYDRLTLVNVAAHKSIGAWDTMIPFYMGDCDMHSRITMAGYEILDAKAGLVYDVGSSLDDLLILYRQKRGPNGDVADASFLDPNIAAKAAEEAAERLEAEKGSVEKRGADEEAAVSKEAVLREQELKDAKEKLLKEKDKAAASAADSLAALFVPSSVPLTPHPATRPEPDLSLWTEDAPFSSTYTQLLDVLDHMQNSKNSGDRNRWQARQSGGQGEPFYRDSAGFERGIQMTIEHGRAMYREKWGHRDCDIVQVGYRADDAWRVEQDW